MKGCVETTRAGEQWLRRYSKPTTIDRPSRAAMQIIWRNALSVRSMTPCPISRLKHSTIWYLHCHSPSREWASLIPSARAKGKQNFSLSESTTSPSRSKSSPSPPLWPRMSKISCGEALYVDLESPTPS